MSRLRRHFRFGLSALLIVLLGGCAKCTNRTSDLNPTTTTPSRTHPNVLLITLDTTRADRLGCYGRTLARTPRLDRLAQEGVLVEHAVSSAPITAPSHSSMLTGLYPATHGVRDNGSFRLPDAVTTLPEILRTNGYTSAAFVSASVLHRRYNLSQGFDVYDDDLWSEDAPEMFMIRERRGSRTVEHAKSWLTQWFADANRKPFFSWVHLFDVHQPHQAPAADAVLTMSDYDAEVASVDRYVGDLLDHLSSIHELDNTLVVVTADHGESLGEHGEATHAVFVYESTVHVPLLLRYPATLRAGTRYTGPVRHIDLLPTILAALSIPHDGYVQGVDLWPALRGEVAAPSLAQYSESLVSELGFGMAPLFALRQAEFTYVRAPRRELYNRASDRGETRNIAEADAARAREMDQALSAILHECETHAFETDRSAIDQETAENLRALGYVGDPGVANAMNGLDPKDGIRLYQAMHRARALVRHRRFEESIAISRDVLTQTPANLSAINLIAFAQLEGGDEQAARATYAHSLEIDPDQERIHLQLATLDMAANRLDDAQRHLDTALADSPNFVEGVIALGMLAWKRHDAPATERAFARALAIDPTYPRALHAFADFQFRQGNYAEALHYYEETLERSPNSFDSLNQAGATARRLGRLDEALRYFERASRVRPDSWIPPYNRGCALALASREGEAMEALGRAAALHMPHPEILQTDADLISLREKPEFAQLLQQARRAARPAARATLDE